ncbi:MAG: hypothetical protein WC679_01105 [Bacteroidales bacterium]|jgi:hypothetical protein
MINEEMTITMPIGEISKRCNDWDLFCNDTGWDYYCMKEGVDPDTPVKLSTKQLLKYGIIKFDEI